VLPLVAQYLWFNISTVNPKRIGIFDFGCEAVCRNNPEFNFEKVFVT
jgi:hypothetical protein